MQTPGEVLIVGAGPTGMTAALELSRMGIHVRLVEKTCKPATTSRAVGVQARTLELFEQRGLSQRMVERGNQGVAVSAYGGGKRVFRLEFKDLDSKYKYILFISQAETEATLRDALEKAGVKIEWNVTMIAFGEAEQSNGVTAVLQQKDGTLERLNCAYLISAEGAHSTARQTLGLDFEGKSLNEQYALGDFYIDGELPDSDLHVFSSEHGFLGMFPMGNKRYRVIAANPISKPSADTKPSLDELQQLFDQRSPIPAKFRDLQWSSWFHINSRMIHTMKVGHIFLGGDASHIHSPAGAQGMNTGIQDMIDLCWKLAMVMKDAAKPELLDTYAQDRAPVIENVLTKTEGLTKAIGAENPMFRGLFDHIAPLVVGTDFIQHNSTRQMSQLGLNYRDSPLSAQHGAPGSLRAGDRVPDLPVTLLHGEGLAEQQRKPATLFGLLDPSAFTLLFSNINDSLKTRTEVHDAIGPWDYLMHGYQIAAADQNAADFDQLFGTSSSILLVRPDGYIAFAGTEKTVAALAGYCDRWLIARLASANSQQHHG